MNRAQRRKLKQIDDRAKRKAIQGGRQYVSVAALDGAICAVEFAGSSRDEALRILDEQVGERNRKYFAARHA